MLRTNLISDTHIYNDTISYVFDKDAALTSILLPQNIEIIGDSTQVVVAITNNGFDTITNLNLEYDINSFALVQENWTGIIPPNHNLIYYFNKYYHVNMGINKICARLSLNGDTKISNNESCKYVTGVVATKIAVKDEFVVYQNMPNPFSNSTNIRFNSPNSQKIVLKIFDVFGKLLFSRDINAVKGKNNYYLSLNDFSSGVYIYELRGDDKVVRMKMIISK